MSIKDSLLWSSTFSSEFRASLNVSNPLSVPSTSETSLASQDFNCARQREPVQRWRIKLINRYHCWWSVLSIYKWQSVNLLSEDILFFVFNNSSPSSGLKISLFFFFLFFFLFLLFLLSVLSSDSLLSSFSPVYLWNQIRDGNMTSGSKLVNNFSLADCTVQAGLRIIGKITPVLHNTKIPIDCINSKV